MSVNTRTEYALRALLEVQASGEGIISAKTICEKQDLPLKYIEHLLTDLRNAGIISSSAGSKGGYVLTRPATEISLLDVMAAVKDDSQLLGCEFGRQYCLGEGCGLLPVFSEVAMKQRELFESYTLDKIAATWQGSNK